MQIKFNFSISDQWFLASGLALGLLWSWNFWNHGHSAFFLILWVVSLLLITLYYYFQRERHETPLPAYIQEDLLAVLFLLVSFAPLYLGLVHLFPFQIDMDELTDMCSEGNEWLQHPLRILGLSDYFSFPASFLILRAWIGQLMGGMTVAHMRFLAGLFGLASVGLSYLLFRLGWPIAESTAAAIVLGVNHPMLGFSRMALYTNSSLFTELGALALLLRGFQRSCPFYSFLGGLAVGLTFHAYQPAKITIVLWILFLAIQVFRMKDKISMQRILKLGGISGLGFVWLALPIVLATVKGAPGTLEFNRHVFLILPEGQHLQRSWVSAQSDSEGIKTNILYGLTAFNNRVQDHAWTYKNGYTHSGFLDPSSGIFLWIGLLAIVWKSPKTQIDILMVTGFLLLWLSFSFLVNKAPNYARLLVTLPFVAYLAVEGLKAAASGIQKWLLPAQLNARKFLLILGVLVIGFWNLKIFGEVMADGEQQDNFIRGTLAYLEQRKGKPHYSYYVAASSEYPFWQDFRMSLTHVRFFIDPDQDAQLLNPENCITAPKSRPFTILMGEKLWLETRLIWFNLYPLLQVHDIAPDGSLVAMEVS